MNKEMLSKKQMQLLIFTYPIGSYLLFNMGASVKQDAWIASIIGVVISIPILIMYGNLMDLYPGKNLFDILEIVFGKFFGKFLDIIFIFHLLFVASYILHNLIDFVKLSALWNTPAFIPTLCIGILSLWMLKKGIHVIFNWAKFNIRLVLSFMFLVWLLLLPKFQVSNLQPLFYNGFEKTFKEGASLAVYPFIELFIFLSFFDTVTCDSNIKSIFISPVIISGFFIILINISNLMLIGGEEYSSFYYPGYEAIKRMHLRGEYQRLEIIVSIVFTIMRFLEITYCLLGASKGVQKLFNLNDYRDILSPVVFLSLNFSHIMFGSIMEAQEFVKDLWTFYGVLLQVVLPVIIFAAALIKKRFFNKSD